jgi:hypothetical protein
MMAITEMQRIKQERNKEKNEGIRSTVSLHRYRKEVSTTKERTGTSQINKSQGWDGEKSKCEGVSERERMWGWARRIIVRFLTDPRRRQNRLILFEQSTPREKRCYEREPDRQRENGWLGNGAGSERTAKGGRNL